MKLNLHTIDTNISENPMCSITNLNTFLNGHQSEKLLSINHSNRLMQII